MQRHTIIFIDTEGVPFQEVSAIAICAESYEILDVFHEHVQINDDIDAWARDHVHGLNEERLRRNGWRFENSLVTTFKLWLQNKNFVLLYGNNPRTERHRLSLNICDLLLPPWVERCQKSYHLVAQKFKKFNIPIHGISCNPLAHSSYQRPAPCTNEAVYLAKWQHGHHCSLYDCYELYLKFLLDDE